MRKSNSQSNGKRCQLQPVGWFRPGELCRLAGVSRSVLIDVETRLGLSPQRINGRGDRRYDVDQARRLLSAIADHTNPRKRALAKLEELEEPGGVMP